MPLCAVGAIVFRPAQGHGAEVVVLLVRLLVSPGPLPGEQRDGCVGRFVAGVGGFALPAAHLEVPVLVEDVIYDFEDAVRVHARPPAELAYRVVDDTLARVAARLHGVAEVGTERADTVTLAHRDRVGRVVHVRNGQRGHGRRVGIVGRRERQVQPHRGHTLARRLKGHSGRAKRHAEQRRERTTQRVAGNPNLGVGIHVGDVVKQVRGGWIVERLFDKRALETRLAAGRVALVAVAHGRP